MIDNTMILNMRNSQSSLFEMTAQADPEVKPKYAVPEPHRSPFAQEMYVSFMNWCAQTAAMSDGFIQRESKTTSEPKTEAEPTLKPEGEPKTEAEPTPKPEGEPKTEAEPAPKPEGEPKTEAEPTPKPEGEPKTEAEPTPKPEGEPKTEAEDEPLPELKAESTSETDLNAVESANGTKEVVETCARISGFHKKEWRAFLELYTTVVKTLHALRNDAKGGVFVPEDLGRPSSVLLLSALTQLECQIGLICSYFPKGGVIRDLELIRKLDKLTQEVTNLFPDDLNVLRDIFQPQLPWTHESICQQITAAESGFKGLCERMQESDLVCKSAYYVQQEVLVGDLREHMRLLIIWTKWLCRASKSMIRSSGLQWFSNESLKNELLQKTVVSHKFLTIQVCHTQNPSCLLTPDRLEQPGALHSAFANLKSREMPGEGIDKAALAKQKNSLAVTVYTVLWHTLTAMRKNGWLSCRFAKLMRSKILALDDSDCRLFATMNASFPQHVTTLISEFLDTNCDRYGRVLESLKTPALDSDLNPLQKTRCEEFCLAFLRYAQASTRVLSARSLEVVAWINLIEELLEHTA